MGKTGTLQPFLHSHSTQRANRQPLFGCFDNALITEHNGVALHGLPSEFTPECTRGTGGGVNGAQPKVKPSVHCPQQSSDVHDTQSTNKKRTRDHP